MESHKHHEHSHSHDHSHEHGHGKDEHHHAHEQKHESFFTEAAESWDDRPGIKELAESVFRSLKAKVEFNDQMNVMEFGCGTGNLSLLLAPHVKHILAFDQAEGMISVLKRKCSAAGTQNIVTHCGELHDAVGISEQRFDLIVSVMTMHHVEDTQAVFTQLSTMLASGGRLIVYDLMSEEGTWGFHSEKSHKHGGVHHGHGFKPADLEQQFSAAGLENVHVAKDFVHAKPQDADATGGEYAILCAVGFRPAGVHAVKAAAADVDGLMD